MSPTLLPPGFPQGPNSITYDHTKKITDDPYFAGWFNPIPQWWFLSALDYPNLSAPGGPPTNEFSHFYQAYAVDNLTRGDYLFPEIDLWPETDLYPGDGMDSANASVSGLRTGDDHIPTSDSAIRAFAGERDPDESILFAGDSAEAIMVDFDPVPDTVRPVVEPVWDPGDVH
jgi:hypothetical protein